MERLDKYLAARGEGSRKEVQKLIRSGAVSVNGEICKSPDTKLDAEADEVSVGGRIIGADEYIYIMMNKPAGVVSATEDRREKTVLDILPNELKRPKLFPAGRLDKDTEGLLIITNDGGFAHRILSPKNHVYKKYVAKVDKEITGDDIRRFREGIELPGGVRALPGFLEIPSENEKTTGIVSICEGKYHQVKKMFEACGKKVVHLQRISMGNLYLDSKLPIGSCKLLTKLDIEAIFMGIIH